MEKVRSLRCLDGDVGQWVQGCAFYHSTLSSVPEAETQLVAAMKNKYSANKTVGDIRDVQIDTFPNVFDPGSFLVLATFQIRLSESERFSWEYSFALRDYAMVQSQLQSADPDNHEQLIALHTQAAKFKAINDEKYKRFHEFEKTEQSLHTESASNADMDEALEPCPEHDC